MNLATHHLRTFIPNFLWYNNGMPVVTSDTAPLTPTKDRFAMAVKKVEGTLVVYKITCVVSGKMYVGLTKNGLEWRKRQHLANSRNGRRDGPLYRAIAKHGRENFIFEILCEVPTAEEARAAERHWIAELGTLTPHGYNLTDGGEGGAGVRPSDESIAKMRAFKLGKKQTEEHKAKISAAGRGRIHSPETRAKQSAARKGWKPSEETIQKMRDARTGVRWSEESKAKASASHKGIPWTAEKRAQMAVIQQTPEYREKMRAASAKGRAARKPTTEETKDKLRAAVAKRFSSPEAREESRVRATALMADPERRQRVSAAVKARWNDPEYRARHSEAMAVVTADPLYKEKTRAANLKRLENPGINKKISESLKALHQDPEYRARYAQGREKMKAKSNGPIPLQTEMEV